MTIEYLIWAVLKKEQLDIWERQEIANVLKQLIKESDDADTSS